MKRKVAILRKFMVAVGVIFLGSVRGYAQNTPTLSIAAAKEGITSNEFGTAKDFEFYMEPSGFPRAVTAGETIFMMGSWPSGNSPTMSDDKSNSWASTSSCTDSTGISHGFFYAVNAAVNTSVLTETHSSNVQNTVMDWAHFYNMSTTSSGFVDGQSCQTGVTPTSNTTPNISGTAYTTTTNNDLILVCVYVEQNPFTNPNAITGITWPSGFTGLSEETRFGHACAYGVQTTAGSFTPTFTVAQSTHNNFTIMSAAFKAGTGGTAPPAGASILLSEMLFESSAGQTNTVYLPCPATTNAVAVMAEVGDMTAVSDSAGSSGWSHVATQSFFANIYYLINPTVTNWNTYTVSMTFDSTGNYDLVGLYCLGNIAGVDTAATAQNSSTLNGSDSGSTYHGSIRESGSTVTDVPSIGTSVPGDLVLTAGAIGTGPATSCITGQCVFDYVGSTSWVNGDNEAYANGDVMAHQYAATASTVDIEYNIVNTGSSISGMSLALKPGSSGGAGAPAPPSGLQATVQAVQ